MRIIERISRPSAVAWVAAFLALSTAAMAQATVGGAGGGGTGDAVVTWFYTNYMHAIAVAGLLTILIGALFMRSHIMYFVVAGVVLLCIGNYASIIALFGI